MVSTRLYHFMCKKYALKSIIERRLKISMINDLNDPFEAFKFKIPGRFFRKKFHLDRLSFSQRYGILCFSKKWSNPLMWSHYSDCHRGVCLGFDVSGENLLPVDYVDKRADHRRPLTKNPDRDEIIRSCLKTKYASWCYEEEVRRVELLEDSEKGQDNLRYTPFSQDLVLREIIIGARLQNSRNEIEQSLGNLRDLVEVINTRLAFNSFHIMRQKNSKLWN